MKQKTTYLIGGIDSFGVPYTRDNKDHINHLKVVRDYLHDYYTNIKMIDMYSMNKYNTTTYINDILTHNLDLYQITANQSESIDLCRKNGIFQYIQLPKNTKKLYIPDESTKNIGIKDIVLDNNIFFIYSCGINDFLQMMNTNLGKLLSPKNMRDALKDLEITITEIMMKIQSNLDLLITLNPNIEIYVLSVYIPTRVKYIRDMVYEPINLFNHHLNTLCSTYKNVHFVNNANLTKQEMAHIDWHPNYHGQVMIGNNIISSIANNSKKLTNIKS